MARCIASSSKKIDVVHVTSKSVGLFEFARTLKKYGIKVVYTLHDPTPHETNIRSIRRRIAGYLFDSDKYNKMALNQVDRIHVHSETHKKEIIKKYGASFEFKTYVVPLGSGLTEAIKQGSRIPVELGSWKRDNLTALFFGRIEPYKGLRILCKAIQILKLNGIIVNLIIAGSGAFDNSLIDGITEQCRVINRFIEDSEIKSIFSSCDACVLPYVDGTQSAVIPLAYNFSKPVIATNVGALSELVVNDVTGYLVEPCNVELLAKALIKINDKNECSRLGFNAYNYAKDISWDKMVVMHIAEYLKLLVQDA
jgi:glycosyltransferase involved in cell wall biosynthesis